MHENSLLVYFNIQWGEMLLVHGLSFIKPVKQIQFKESKKEIFLKFLCSGYSSLKIKTTKIKLYVCNQFPINISSEFCLVVIPVLNLSPSTF